MIHDFSKYIQHYFRVSETILKTIPLWGKLAAYLSLQVSSTMFKFEYISKDDIFDNFSWIHRTFLLREKWR